MIPAKIAIQEVLQSVDDSATFEEIQRLIRQRERELLPAHLIEHRQIAEAGMQLAAETWPKDDFSDWEKGHGHAIHFALELPF